jgi:hypothetical protein
MNLKNSEGSPRAVLFLWILIALLLGAVTFAFRGAVVIG